MRVGAAQSSLTARSGPLPGGDADRAAPAVRSAARQRRRQGATSTGLRRAGGTRRAAGTRRQARRRARRRSPRQRAVPAASAQQPPRRPRIRPSSRTASSGSTPVSDRAVSYASAELREACLTRERCWRTASSRYGKDSATWAIGASPETASWLANLLGSGVLPVLYGFLGAIAAVVRTLSRKIKGSLLSPRDVQLTFQQLALGAVVGACISLFIAAPGRRRQRHLAARAGRAVERRRLLRRRFRGGFGVQGAGSADLEDLQPRAGRSGPDRRPGAAG